MSYLPKGRPTANQDKMIGECCVFAAHVIRDMGAAFAKKGPFWADYLGQRFGGYGWADLRDIDAAGAYYLDTQDILLDWRLWGKERRCRTLRHEIAHRLCFSGRYDDLEGPHLAGYDLLTFAEMVAEIVVLAFKHPGTYANLMSYLN